VIQRRDVFSYVWQPGLRFSSGTCIGVRLAARGPWLAAGDGGLALMLDRTLDGRGLRLAAKGGLLFLWLRLPPSWAASDWRPRAAGMEWSEHGLVFASRTGGALDAANVRRDFKAACRSAKIGEQWTPRELRHSFVSLMSSSGVPVEEIARLAGHSNTRTTEVVYRRELRPVLTTGAEAMDRIFRPTAARAATEIERPGSTEAGRGSVRSGRGAR
jgi:Phage integrase family